MGGHSLRHTTHRYQAYKRRIRPGAEFARSVRGLAAGRRPISDRETDLVPVLALQSGESLLSCFEWYRWRRPRAGLLSMALPKTVTRRRGWTMGVGSSMELMRSVETKFTALVGPAHGELAGAHQSDRAELRGLASLDNRLGDLGRQEAQPEDAGEVGSAEACLGREVLDRLAVAAHHQIVQPPCQRDESQEAAIRLACGFGLPLDNQLVRKSGPFHARRYRQDGGRAPVRFAWPAMVFVSSDFLEDPQRMDGNLDGLGSDLDPG